MQCCLTSVDQVLQEMVTDYNFRQTKWTYGACHGKVTRKLQIFCQQNILIKTKIKSGNIKKQHQEISMYQEL